MLHCLGKTPARPGAIKLKFSSYANASVLPTPPLVFGRFSEIDQWAVLGNNSVGNCVIAGGEHETMSWCAMASRAVPRFTDATAIADYSAITGYVPSDPNTDQGTDMVVAARYRQKTGLVDAAGTRHQIAAYAALRVRDLDQLALACYLLGAVGVGVELPKSAPDQFDSAEPWDVVSGSSVVGGHYLPIVGRNSRGNFLAVSWGRLTALTPEFLDNYQDEAVAYFSPEWLKPDNTQRGFDSAALAADLARITA